MINRFFFLFSASIFLFGNISRSIASSSFPTYTQHTPMEPEPASLLDLDHSYKTASVCFLGKNGCGDDGKFNKGDNYELDSVQQCKNEGFNITTCTAPEAPYGQCPYNDGYFKECKDLTAEKCKDAGYDNSCPEGNILDDTQVCPYNGSYKKCKCNPCGGYDYTYAQATSEGYVAGASCNSCGTMKYQRQNAACSGFLSCECGGQIGASSCKSGTNTLFSQCKECVKCDDECPSGYYKTAGGNGRCNFGSNNKTTECGTTCYQCKAPNSGDVYGCLNSCPEGYTLNNETHDYTCKELTCRNKIKAKYSGYYFGDNFNCNWSDNKAYKFDRSFVGTSGRVFYSGTMCPFTNSTITQSFYVEVDFKDEFSQCSNYCRPSTTLTNKTIQGNIFLGVAGSSDRYYTNITVDGTLAFPYGEYYNFDNLTLKANSKLIFKKFSNGSFYVPRLKNVMLYSGSGIGTEQYYIQLYGATISGNTAATPVVLKNVRLNGDITSAHLLSGSTGGIYLNMEYESYGTDLSNYSIKRNSGGKINITLLQQQNTFDLTLTLFKNPGIDTVITLKQSKDHWVSGYYGSGCIILANDLNKKLCSGVKGDAVVTFLTDDAAKQILPSCCSKDTGCAASSWNNGTVKCEGYSKQ